MESLFAFVLHDMSTNREPLAFETIAAESEKFTSPLLFVHGLFGSAAGWRRFMGYCAHRGWTCHALEFPGHRESASGAGPLLRLADLVDRVATAVAAFDPPPVLIGHDLGGLLSLAGAQAARAVVGLAPLPPDSLDATVRGLLSGWRNKVAVMRSQPVTPTPGSSSDDYLCGADSLGFVVPESSRFLVEMGRDAQALELRSQAPTLIVVGEHDRFARPPQLQKLATLLGADFAIATDARHGLPWDKGWEKTVALVHRWIVQTLGEELLVVREDEDDE